MSGKTIRRTGIFGGSFDPPHKGHLSIVKSWIRAGAFDRLMIIPAMLSPHKKTGYQASFNHRAEMCRIAFSGVPKAEISEIEKDLPIPSYTLKTVDELIRTYPEDDFFLCIGSDSLETISSWYKSDQLLEKTRLMVAERPGFDRSRVPEKILRKTEFVEHDPVDISSTELREELKRGKKPEMISGDVFDYIREHQLYLS